jgi:2-polyprenyl-3-methyl-5-hydroxy-6-metoxy-1,4-benzoquinol methylase
MTKRGYQHNFSRLGGGAMYDYQARERKAKTILKVIQDFYKSDTLSFKLLDIGASTGIIDNYLADYFSTVTGTDIDKEAIDYANKTFTKDNLLFKKADAMALEFQNNQFDIVICTQIYEHVPDSQILLNEIYRVLKPGGICYFAAGNRLSLMEPHYGLPFLSIIPRPLAHIYMRLTGKGDHYHEKHLFLFGLKKLVRSFILHDYTKKIIAEPEKFHAAYMLKPRSAKHKTAHIIVNWAYWFCPTYIWILEKPENS